METKRLTATFSLLIVIWMMSYSAIIAGTFIHEMTHIRNAIQPHAITISFNGNGEATATELKRMRL